MKDGRYISNFQYGPKCTKHKKMFVEKIIHFFENNFNSHRRDVNQRDKV